MKANKLHFVYSQIYRKDPTSQYKRWEPNDYSRICSQHFLPEGTIPTVNLGHDRKQVKERKAPKTLCNCQHCKGLQKETLKCCLAITSANTIITSTNTIITSTNTIIASADAVFVTTTIVNTAATLSQLCLHTSLLQQWFVQVLPGKG